MLAAAVVASLALAGAAAASVLTPTTRLYPKTHGLDIGAPEPLLARIADYHELPLNWCGQDRTTDDVADELANGTHRYHAIYAIAADGADRLQAQADTIQYSMVAASALLENLYGRAIRFDMGTSCGHGYIDVTTLRLPQTSAQLKTLSSDPTLVLDTISNDLSAAGFPTTRAGDTVEAASARTTNWVIFLDAPGPSACGMASGFQDSRRSAANPNNYGGQLALLFKVFDGRFCGPDAVRHEIGHTLGAVQSVAPHAYDGWHCNDSNEDTMCYGWTQQGLPGHTYFDYHNDDYWDPPNGPPLPWWTVNLDDFLCPDADCNVAPELRDAPLAPAQPVATPSTTRSIRGLPVRIRMHAVQRSGRWHVRLSLRHGKGTAWVLMRCDDHPERWMLNRPAELGATLRATGRCSTRPRAGAFRLT